MAGGKHKNFQVSFKQRQDKKAFLFAPKDPYFMTPDSLIKKQKSGLLVFPLPVATFMRIPCWHTMYFVVKERIMKHIIKRAMKEHDNFYYVMHPRDLFDYGSDLTDDFKREYKDELTVFESLAVPIEEKLKYVDSALDLISKSGRKFVTLREMADSYYEEEKK